MDLVFLPLLTRKPDERVRAAVEQRAAARDGWPARVSDRAPGGCPARVVRPATRPDAAG